MGNKQGKVECPYCHETIGFSVRKEEKYPGGCLMIVFMIIVITAITTLVLLSCAYGYCI